MKLAIFVLPLLFAVPAAPAQTPQPEFTDPVALLQAVAKTYATETSTFRMESITVSEQNSELQRDWHKVYRTAIKGPGNLYRIETRSPYGSFIQDSDGSYEWVYLIEANTYVKRPLPQKWPQFPLIAMGGNNEVMQAWNTSTWLEGEASSYKHASFLPQEIIVVEGRSYVCYVVHVTSADDTRRQDKEAHSENTFWIDKTALVFRKRMEHSDAYMIAGPEIHIPFHEDRTTIYPVMDFAPQTTAEMFRFTPPADAREVKTMEPNFDMLPSAHPKAAMAGQMAPEVSLTAADGKKVALSSYRGKPLLIDFWATWCGPCLLSMPGLERIYADVKDKGLTVVTVDQDDTPESATGYLARHHDAWANFHDAQGAIRKTFKGEGIPLVVLIDAQGKIAYYDFAGDEAALRKAIAALGPEFASVAAAEAGKPSAQPANAESR